MTDFVNRLLGRSGAPPIRPVVPTLFEPPAPVRAEPPLPAGTFTDSGFDPQRTIERPVAEPVAVPLPPADPGGPVPAAALSVPASPAHPMSERNRSLPVAGAAAAPASAAPGFLVEHRVERVHAVHPVPAATREAAPVAAALSPLPAPGGKPVPAAHPRPPEPIHPVTERSRAHPVHRIALARPAMPPVSPAGTRRAAATEPEVHVSIGRVEVKATAEPAPRKHREQGRPPALSLNDYLRERAGDDRR
jgi:hypothetical protein